MNTKILQQIYGDNPERTKRWEWLVGSPEKLKADFLESAQGAYKSIPDVSLMTLRIGTEILLENTMQAIANELGDAKLMQLDPQKFYEEIDTSSIVPFTRFALPMVRRVTPRLFAKGLFGFQPMPMPDGKIFYFDTFYGTQKYPTNVGDRVDLVNKMNKSYGGARMFERFTGAGGVNQTFNLANYGAKNVRVFVNGVQLTSGVVHTAGANSGTFDTVVVTPAPALNATVDVVYENVAEGDVARDINIGMSSKNITAESIKLRAGMTVETMQDFSAYHGINSDVELTNAMANEVDREIDLNLLHRCLFNAAGGNVNWDAAGYLAGDDNTFYRKEYRKTLYEAIVMANNLVYSKRFVNTTWIVGGVGAVERLEKLEEFKMTPDTTPDDAGIGRRFEGTLAGKWRVYKDARFSDTTLLLGYSGMTPFHTGAVYAPYIPAYWTDLLPDPNINFKVRKGVMSRYGFEVVIPECYATVTIV